MGAPFIMPAPVVLPPHVLRRKLWRVIADAKNLLCLLDEEQGIDPDPDEDKEPQAGFDLPEGDDERCASDQVDDEPDLGWVTHDSGLIEIGIYAGDREHDTADHEPSLGSLDTRESQVGWAGGGDDDREHENEDDLTAPERHGRGFVQCALDDAEDDDPGGSDDNGDHGIADIDGLSEQWQGTFTGALPFSFGGYVA